MTSVGAAPGRWSFAVVVGALVVFLVSRAGSR